MAKRQRPKRKTSAEIAAELDARRTREKLERLAARGRDLEAVGLPKDAAILETHSNIEVIRTGADRDGQTVDHDVARRLDAFEALRPTMAHLVGAYDAARRLEADMLTRLGMGDGGRSMSRVDGEQRRDKTDIMRKAGEAVDAVLALIPERDQWLLAQLIQNTLGKPDWRAIVAHITAETNPSAQAAVVRSACSNLAEAYAKLAAPKQRREVA